MYNSKCEWCGHTRVILNACILYVCLTKGMWFKIYKVPYNVWAGSILAKGKSDDLTAIFAQDDHVTADILFKVKRDTSPLSWLRVRLTD